MPPTALTGAVALFTMLLGVASVAAADTAATPVGTLTATQAEGPCGDLGAAVVVDVTGGFPGASYTATGSQWSTPARFVTDGNGEGEGIVFNVLTDAPARWEGYATITVTAGGQVGEVRAYISCVPPDGKD
jgi:hypothetical protein